MKFMFILHVYEMKVLSNYYYSSLTSIMLMFKHSILYNQDKLHN